MYQEVLAGLDEGYSFNSAIADALYPQDPHGWPQHVTLETLIRLAEEWDLSLSGTLGCLVAAIEQGRLSLAEGNKLLARMLVQGYRSAVRDLSDVVGST